MVIIRTAKTLRNGHGWNLKIKKKENREEQPGCIRIIWRLKKSTFMYIFISVDEIKNFHCKWAAAGGNKEHPMKPSSDFMGADSKRERIK